MAAGLIGLCGVAAVLLYSAAAQGAAPAEGQQPPAASVNITIHDDQVLHTVSEHFGGTNFVALWNATGDSPGTVHAFSQMGLSLVRFPGGVPAQFYNWEKPLDSGWTVLTPQRAWNLAKAGNAQLVFQTNVANNSSDTNKKTGKTFRFDNSGAHQAAWVRFAKSKGMQVAFWEIGNEPEMDAPKDIKEPKLPRSLTGRDRDQKIQQGIYDWYNAKYAEQAKAIKAADPQARIMGPAATNVWFWWGLGNLEKFIKVHGNKGGTGLADAISLHWYIEGDHTWEKLRSAPQGWQDAMNYVNATLAKYDTRKLPVYITEWNWGGGMNNDTASQLACALGNADVIGMFLRTGVQGHMHFCLQRIKQGWGMLAMGNDDSKPENAPSPAYFALAMTAQLGSRVLKLDNPSNEKDVLSAYATSKPDGSIQVLLINKSERTQNAMLAFSKYQPAGKSVHVYSLRGANGKVTDTEVTYNGVKEPKPATAKLPAPQTLKATERFVQSLPPYSAAVLVFPAP